MKHVIQSFLLIVCVAMLSCGSKGLTVKGNISEAEGLMIYFDKVGLNQSNQPLTQVEASGSGDFSMNFPEGLSSGIYRVRIGARSIPIILEGTETTINVSGSMESLAKLEYEVEGSPLSSSYRDEFKKYLQGAVAANNMEANVKSLHPMVATMVANTLFRGRSEFTSIHKAALSLMEEKYPDHELTTTYKPIVAGLERAYASKMASEKIKIGEVAPDIALPDPKGKVRSLSELKGKVVLLDFWASWCGPCRKANPHVVEMYNKYNKDGFEVFNVSLDGLDTRTKSRFQNQEQIDMQLERSKERWVAAIEKDGLKWDHHVSDLKKWESAPASVYGVRSIPRTFLIDREGKIAALNPRNNLETELQKLL